MFTQEYPRLVALGVAVAGNREIARELAQETMIRAHGRWLDLERYDDPRAWLRRVMSNLLIDHHRSRTSERSAMERLQRAASDVAAAQADDTERGTPWAELIRPLTPHQGIVATLFYAEDLPVEEIARILEVSAGSVKSTLSKVRRRLRAHLDAPTEGGRS